MFVFEHPMPTGAVNFGMKFNKSRATISMLLQIITKWISMFEKRESLDILR